MAEFAERHATYQDILDVPPELVAEILGCRLVSYPRRVPRHTLRGSSLGDERVGPF